MDLASADIVLRADAVPYADCAIANAAVRAALPGDEWRGLLLSYVSIRASDASRALQSTRDALFMLTSMLGARLALHHAAAASSQLLDAARSPALDPAKELAALDRAIRIEMGRALAPVPMELRPDGRVTVAFEAL